jgi:hypothetical protein
MSERCVGDPAVDVSGYRERRVHQHDRRTHDWVEMVVDVRSGAAESHCHRGAKGMGIDCAATFEIGDQRRGGPEKRNAGTGP